MAYIHGESRSQTTPISVSLERLIPENYPAKVIYLSVARMDLVPMGCDKTLLKCSGRSSYEPATS